MDNPAFYFPAISGAVFALTAWIMMTYPPKKINHFYGYRTPRSMKSQQHWDFAQHYSSKELVRIGIFILLISPLCLLFSISKNTGLIIGMTITFAPLILLIVRTESALKERFPKEDQL